MGACCSLGHVLGLDLNLGEVPGRFSKQVPKQPAGLVRCSRQLCALSPGSSQLAQAKAGEPPGGAQIQCHPRWLQKAVAQSWVWLAGGQRPSDYQEPKDSPSQTHSGLILGGCRGIGNEADHH